MTHYNTLHIKFSNSQLNKLKSGIKNDAQVNLNFSSNITGDANNETNFSHKLLLTNTQVWKICKAFKNGLTTNKFFSKSQLSKMVQLGGFSGKIFGTLIKEGLPLIGNVLKPLAKSILVPLGLTAVTSATDAAIQKKVFQSGTTTLIFANEELNDIIKTI